MGLGLGCGVSVSGMTDFTQSMEHVTLAFQFLLQHSSKWGRRYTVDQSQNDKTMRLHFLQLPRYRMVAPHPAVCSMTSGAIQQGVPTNVLRASCAAPQLPLRSRVADTPKSARRTLPSVSIKILPAWRQGRGGHLERNLEGERD